MRKIFLCLNDAEDHLTMQSILDFAVDLRAYVLGFYPNLLWNQSETATQSGLSLFGLPAIQGYGLQPSREDNYVDISSQFQELSRAKGISWLEAPTERDLPAAWMLPHESSIPLVSKTEISLADLVVFSQAYQREPQGWGALESVMLDVRRLVLVLSRENPFKVRGGRAFIAWDGSVQAARSLIRSIPFLQRADDVFLLCVESGRDELPSPGPAMRYLALYGIHAQRIQCCATRHDADSVGRAILNHVALQEANILVMGGYGSSGSFMEFLVGGVTQYVRSHATVNLLMTH